jgi:hypothetical protein
VIKVVIQYINHNTISRLFLQNRQERFIQLTLTEKFENGNNIITPFQREEKRGSIKFRP